MPTPTQINVMRRAGFTVGFMIIPKIWLFYTPGMGSRNSANYGNEAAAWEGAWQYVLGNTTAASPSIFEAVEQRHSRVMDLKSKGFSVQPSGSHHGVWRDGVRITGAIFSSTQAAWDWAILNTSITDSDSDTDGLKAAGYAVYYTDQLKWTWEEPGACVRHPGWHSEAQAWAEASKAASTVKKSDSAGQLESIVGLFEGWIKPQQPLTLEGLGSEGVRIVRNPAGAMYSWYSRKMGIQSAGFWDTKQGAVDAANAFFTEYFIAKRSEL